ncbi:hypothetical protein ARMSODRAFT_1026066 [Armillaria solidipes]|uniref:Uncharacterized protein n=1 Tax=Armillaria solidipes TaxID=1076256 RepID=A0A2H3B8Q4_9AGAR|nr:hypothetical protein ARMSODRAFT_1026066 [Armillaria solidipes]
MPFRLLPRSIGHHRSTPASPLFIQYRGLSRLPRIQTLNPEALTQSDFRDLSGKLSDLSLGNRFQYAQPSSSTGGRINIAYPNKTAGFYYYWTHPDLPATAGQLRFRITPTNDPSLFESGSDLLKPNGIPWLVSVGKLLNLPNTSYLHKLLKDGLVSKDMISSKYLRTYQKLQLRSSALLESYYDVFPLSLPHSSVTISMMSSTNKVARMNVVLGDHSWVEGLQLTEPGKKVYAHVRLHVFKDARRPGPRSRANFLSQRSAARFELAVDQVI